MNKWKRRARKWQRRYNKEFVCRSFWYTEAGKWMRKYDALLAWQRRVREATPADCVPITRGVTAYMCIAVDDYDALRQAIESEPVEPREAP